MIKDAQVRRLRRLLGEGFPLYLAALKVGMNTETARKYRHAERLPSESFSPRTWRTREDVSGHDLRWLVGRDQRWGIPRPIGGLGKYRWPLLWAVGVVAGRLVGATPPRRSCSDD